VDTCAMSAIHVRVLPQGCPPNAGDRDALLAHSEALTLAADLLARGRTRVATADDGTVVGFATTRPTESACWNSMTSSSSRT
jgi:hypothetical protein